MNKGSDLALSVDGGILNIRVGAIIMRDDKLLMVSNDIADYCYSVGGRIKFGESAEEAVIREVLEETGVKMQIDRLGFVHENFFLGDTDTNRNKKIYEISFYFYMKVPEDFEPVCNSFSEDMHKEYLRWIDIEGDVKYYPEFFRGELKSCGKGVKHFVTRDY